MPFFADVSAICVQKQESFAARRTEKRGYAEYKRTETGRLPPHGGSRYEKAEAGKRSASAYIFLEIGLQVFADAVSKGQFDLFSFYGNGDMGKTDLFKFFRYEFALVRNAAGVVRIGGKDHLPPAQLVISA